MHTFRMAVLAASLLLSVPAFSADDSWKDPETGKIWALLGHSITWAAAVGGCDAMTTAGATYRLPTLDEWWDAYDRIKDTGLARELRTIQLMAWSADAMPGVEPARIWSLYLLSGNAGGVLATAQAAAACVRAGE